MNANATEGSGTGSADSGECQLLGPFAILVQAALGLLALSSLVFKRWRERPQRPVKIWAFDASKQVFGSVLLHLCNLLFSMVSSGDLQAKIAEAAAKVVSDSTDDKVFSPNPCSFYLLNIAIDTTLGIPVLIVILKILTIGVRKTGLVSPPESIRSGNYGDPPKATWWLKQSVIYFIGLMLMKICVFIIFELCPWIVVVGDWALKWTEGNEALQIAFVMLIFPLIMNALQYYIIDTFIKKQPDKEDPAEETAEHGEEESRLLAGEDGRGNSSDETESEEVGKSQVQASTKNSSPSKSPQQEYDPARDGEVETLQGDAHLTSQSTSSTKPPDRSR